MDQKQQDVTESFVISLLTWATKHCLNSNKTLPKLLFLIVESSSRPFQKRTCWPFSLSFLFREVYNFSKYSDEAVKTFKEHRGAMHPVTAMLVAKDLKIDG